MTFEFYEEKLDRLYAYIAKLENQVKAFKNEDRFIQQSKMITRLKKQLEERELNDRQIERDGPFTR